MPCTIVLHLLERGLQGVTKQLPLVRVQPGQQLEQRLFEVTFWQLGLTAIQLRVNGLTQKPVQHSAQYGVKGYVLLQFQSVPQAVGMEEAEKEVGALRAPEPEGIVWEAKGRKTLELPVFCVFDVGVVVGVGEPGVVVVVVVLDVLGGEDADEDEDGVVVDGDGDGVLVSGGMVVGVGVVGVAALFWASSCRRIG